MKLLLVGVALGLAACTNENIDFYSGTVVVPNSEGTTVQWLADINARTLRISAMAEVVGTTEGDIPTLVVHKNGDGVVAPLAKITSVPFDTTISTTSFGRDTVIYLYVTNVQYPKTIGIGNYYIP